MSQQTFASFYDEFLNRPENANLVESINVADSEESFAAKAVEVGKAHGFSFTVDDVNAVMTASIKKQLENVELSEQQLEAVAGGAFSQGLTSSSLVNVNLSKFGTIPGIPDLGAKTRSTYMCPW